MRSNAGLESRADGTTRERWFITPLVVFLATRLALLVLMYASVILLPLNEVPGAARVLPGNWLLDGWVRWDAVGYQVLADQGYWYGPARGLGSATLPPLFPAVVAVATGVGGQTAQTALLLANLFSAAALVALYRLLMDRLGQATALRAVTLTCVLPYGFLLSSAYPHGLALLLVCLSLLAAERRRSWLATVFGSLGPLALPVAVAVWPTLIVIVARARGRRALVPLLLLPLPAIGFAIYLTSAVQLPGSVVARVLLGLGPSSLLPIGSAGPAAPSSAGPHGLLLIFNLGLGLLFLLATPYLPRLLGWPYALFNAGFVLLVLVADPAGLGTWLPLAVPAVAAAAYLLRHEVAELTALGVSSLFLAMLVASFAGWYPFTGDQVSPWAENDPSRLMAMYSAEKALPQHVLALKVADDLLVVGNDLPAARVEPGTDLPVTVYLHRLRATTTNYLLAVHLLDNAGKRWGLAQVLLGKQVDLPRLYQREEGRYRLNLVAEPDTPAGIYSLEVSALIVPPFSTIYERPPVTDLEGAPVEQVIIGRIVVADQGTVMTRATARPPSVQPAMLGQAIELLGHGMDVRATGEGRELQVDLYWSARARPAADYTVFVQALDRNGQVLAQADSYPLAGRFPTSALDASTVVRDTYQLRLPQGAQNGTISVIAGMYSLETMQRLPVSVDGVTVGDHIVLGEIDER
ncbi:MAG: glycosyltransferase family protein [Chloroflexota bacterium]